MLLKTIKNNFKKHKDKTAFVINGSSYTYADLSSKITAIQQKLEERNISTNDIIVVNVYDDIETYAGIFAIWLSGGTFVPINPLHPDDRNRLILEQVNPACILSSNKKDKNKFDAYKNFIATKDLKNGKQEIILAKTDQEKLMYILFTSGSTGIPKGVTISLRNITSFIVDFNKAGYKLSATDRFLQIYDLTFDA